MTQEFVTLPREVVEQAIEAILDAAMPTDALRAALEQPQAVTDCHQSEQPQSEQPAMTPIAQRKLEDLVASGYTISGYSVYHEQKHQHGFVTGAGLVGWWKPEGVEYPQPRGEQKPVATLHCTNECYVYACLTDYGKQMRFEHPLPIYTSPPALREPLTDEEIDKLCPQFDDPMRREMWIIGFKAAHNIK